MALKSVSSTSLLISSLVIETERPPAVTIGAVFNRALILVYSRESGFRDIIFRVSITKSLMSLTKWLEGRGVRGLTG